MPKSYGEAKTFFNQEAHIYYYLGLLLEKEDRTDEATKAYTDAAVYKAAVSELSLFRALALRKLNRFTEAKEVLDEMLSSADNTIENCDLRSYYGVGSPSPLPFETDIVKINLENGNILKAFALLGLGRKSEADETIAKAEQASPYDFRVFTFRKIENNCMY